MTSKLCFGQLNQELKLSVTKYLSTDDKIKLVDIFEPVIATIDTFDTEKFIHHNNLEDDGVDLFLKLNQVKKVLFDPRKGGAYRECVNTNLIKAIENCKNVNIKSIILKGGASDKVIQCFLSKYVENSGNYDVLAFIMRRGLNPHPKLKLHLNAYTFDLPTMAEIYKYQDFITQVTLAEYIKYPLVSEGLTLRSVTDLTFHTVRYYHDNTHVTERLERVLKLTPNVSKLTLHYQTGGITNSQFLKCLELVPKVRDLNLFGCNSFNPGQLEELIHRFIDENVLTKLSVSHYPMDFQKGMDINNIIGMNIKKRFKTLRLQSYCPYNMDVHGDSFYMSGKHKFAKSVDRRLFITGSTLKIKGVKSSLVDIFHTFPYIKYVDVVTEDEIYIGQLNRDIEKIRDTLPRIRNITLAVYENNHRYNFHIPST